MIPACSFRCTEAVCPSRCPSPIPGSTLYTQWNATADVAATVVMQPSKLWSTVHTLIHNMEDPMPVNQVSRPNALKPVKPRRNP